jgi:hypothetical protein
MFQVLQLRHANKSRGKTRPLSGPAVAVGPRCWLQARADVWWIAHMSHEVGSVVVACLRRNSFSLTRVAHVRCPRPRAAKADFKRPSRPTDSTSSHAPSTILCTLQPLICTTTVINICTCMWVSGSEFQVLLARAAACFLHAPRRGA